MTMDFRQNFDGTYIVSFRAKELPSIVRMVKVIESWKIDDAEKALVVTEKAEAELAAPTDTPVKE